MFLTKRKNSKNWQLELRFPKNFLFDVGSATIFGGRKHFTKSLETADEEIAAIRAAPYIHHFRIALYQWKHRRALPSIDEFAGGAVMPVGPAPVRYEKSRYADGLHIINGLQAAVTGHLITFYGADGKPVRTASNAPEWTMHAPLVQDAQTAEAVLALEPSAIVPPRFTPKRKSADEQMVENYITEKALRPAIAAEVRVTWHSYQDIIGTPLSKATRQDAKRFAQALAQGPRPLAHATVVKKLGWLSAAIKHATTEHDYVGPNPFAGAVGKSVGEKEAERTSLTEDQMRACWAALHNLTPADQLLWRLLAKTGMRLGEAHGITSEGRDRVGVRFVKVGTKTDASLREVPIPLDIGMPDEINKRLFHGSTAAASKRLNRFLRDTLPNTEGIVVHSLRHRAADVFRLQKDTDPYLRRRLLGHAAQDVHDTYGGGVPLDRLLSMIDANPIDGSPV